MLADQWAGAQWWRLLLRSHRARLFYGNPVISTRAPGPDSVQHPVPYAVRVRTSARTPTPSHAPSLSVRRLRARDPGFVVVVARVAHARPKKNFTKAQAPSFLPVSVERHMLRPAAPLYNFVPLQVESKSGAKGPYHPEPRQTLGAVTGSLRELGKRARTVGGDPSCSHSVRLRSSVLRAYARESLGIPTSGSHSQ